MEILAVAHKEDLEAYEAISGKLVVPKSLDHELILQMLPTLQRFAAIIIVHGSLDKESFKALLSQSLKLKKSNPDIEIHVVAQDGALPPELISKLLPFVSFESSIDKVPLIRRKDRAKEDLDVATLFNEIASSERNVPEAISVDKDTVLSMLGIKSEAAPYEAPGSLSLDSILGASNAAFGQQDRDTAGAADRGSEKIIITPEHLIDRTVPPHIVQCESDEPQKPTAQDEELASSEPRGIRKFIRDVIGIGDLDEKQLPAIPQESIPSVITNPYFITFWSTKGGTGKTTVALNTCAYISVMTNLRVIIVDVDEFGDSAISLGAMSADVGHLPTIDELIDNITTVRTFKDLSKYLLKDTTTGLYILNPSRRGSTSQKPTRNDYQNVINILKKHFDIIAFDCGDRLGDEYVKFALNKANFIVLVADQEITTLIHLSQAVRMFAEPETGIGKDKLILVVNKYMNNVDMSYKEIQDYFQNGVSSVHKIPAIFVESLKILNKGDFLIFSKNSEIKFAYRDIASDILSKIKAKQGA